MLRFLTKSLICNYHNVYKLQQPSIKSVNFLQTLAFQSNNSNTSSLENQDSPTVSYLVNKCGFPLKSAISASKHTTITSTEKADSVLQLFNSYGLTQTQITRLVASYPQLIHYDSAKTLKPKFEFFESLGLSREDLAKIFSSDRNFLLSSLRNRMIPTVDFLKSVLETDANVVYALKRWPSIIYTNHRIEVEPNLLTLRACGVAESDICTFLMMYPRSFMVRHEVFQDKVRRVETLGVSPKTRCFLRCLRILLSVSDTLWGEKVAVYKSFGWSDTDILAAFKKQPSCFACSKKKVRLMMDFYLNKLGLRPSDVAMCPNLLILSLEKRIIPRCSVIQLLLSKGLISEFKLVSSLNIMSALFEKMFVTKYQEVVPDIISVYQGKKGFPRFETMHMLPSINLVSTMEKPEGTRSVSKIHEKGSSSESG